MSVPFKTPGIDEPEDSWHESTCDLTAGGPGNGTMISLVTLGVASLTRARTFYEELGWRGAKQPDDEVCFFQAGGMVFGLWTALGGHGAPGIELAHNVRSPEDVGALLADAERAGGTIVRPAAKADWGGTTGAFPGSPGGSAGGG